MRSCDELITSRPYRAPDIARMRALHLPSLPADPGELSCECLCSRLPYHERQNRNRQTVNVNSCLMGILVSKQVVAVVGYELIHSLSGQHERKTYAG